MKRSLLMTIAFATALTLAGCGGGQKLQTNPPPTSATPTTIVVSAAASMTDALQAIQKEFAAQHPDIQVQFNFGSSGALEQQIEQGAPADLFISAGKAQVDALVQKNLADAAAVQTLASNRVVLITSKATPTVKAWDDLKSAQVTHIAIGDPAHVPAGQYGKDVLNALGLWSAVQPKLVLDQDVREVLHHVESGDAQAGIVYSTDAASSPKVTVVALAPAGSHKPVTYPMAVLKGAAHGAQAQAFEQYLLSDKGQAVLKQFGFGAAQ